MGGHFPSLSCGRKSVTMALDARSRSSIYGKFVPILGEHDANALMSEFPSVEGDEVVTKHFLRAELAELRVEMVDRLRQQTTMLGGAIAAATALIIASMPLLT
jgi:hypothetical protein